jgi:hypothetical protein
MTIETLAQAEIAQRRIEEFARLAHDVSAAVTKLKNAFDALADFPESVDEAMVPLGNAAATIADVACDWAALSNAKFNPNDADDGVSQFIVISAMDNGIYGPFHTHATALEFAEDTDGSVFRLLEADGGDVS